jgi:C4-type Zn-finger protein
MNKVTYYKCPVCQSSWTTQSEAISCRNRHPVKIEKWYYCEVCGQGWNAHAHWGEKGAADLAMKCEQEHRLSGGTKGRYYPLIGEERK